MIVADVGKLVILCVIAAALLFGLIMGRLEGEAWGLLGIIVGYLTGNGVAAVRRQAPMPTLTHRPPPLDDHDHG